MKIKYSKKHLPALGFVGITVGIGIMIGGVITIVLSILSGRLVYPFMIGHGLLVIGISVLIISIDKFGEPLYKKLNEMIQFEGN